MAFCKSPIHAASQGSARLCLVEKTTQITGACRFPTVLTRTVGLFRRSGVAQWSPGDVASRFASACVGGVLMALPRQQLLFCNNILHCESWLKKAALGSRFAGQHWPNSAPRVMPETSRMRLSVLPRRQPRQPLTNFRTTARKSRSSWHVCC